VRPKKKKNKSCGRGLFEFFFLIAKKEMGNELTLTLYEAMEERPPHTRGRPKDLNGDSFRERLRKEGSSQALSNLTRGEGKTKHNRNTENTILQQRAGDMSSTSGKGSLTKNNLFLYSCYGTRKKASSRILFRYTHKREKENQYRERHESMPS